MSERWRRGFLGQFRGWALIVAERGKFHPIAVNARRHEIASCKHFSCSPLASKIAVLLSNTDASALTKWRSADITRIGATTSNASANLASAFCATAFRSTKFSSDLTGTIGL